MGQDTYNAYVEAQEHADRVWQAYGDGPEADEAQNEANELYEKWHWLVYGEGPNGERFE